MDGIRHRCSFVDHVWVCSADHQDVENPFGRRRERINTHPIWGGGYIMDGVRNSSRRLHYYRCQCHMFIYSHHRIRGLCEGKGWYSEEEGMKIRLPLQENGSRILLATACQGSPFNILRAVS